MRHPLYTLLLLSLAIPRLFAASETNAEPAKTATPAPVKAAVTPAPAPAPAAESVKAAPAIVPAAAPKQAAAPVAVTAPAAVPAPAEDGATKTVAKGSENEDSDGEKDSSEPTETEKPADPRFERYKTIMDRMPFGPEPANFDPDGNNSRGAGGAGNVDEAALEAQLSEEAQRILASVRVSALNVTPSGKVAVGFTDSSQQPAVTYYMKVGESRNGWSVKDADMKAMTVTLEKDGVEATMKLGEGSDGSKGGKGPSGAAGRMGGGRPMMGGMGRGTGGMGRGMGGGMGMRMGGMRGMGGMTSAGGGMNGAPPANETGSDALARLRARRAQKEAERQAENARISAAAELARQEAAAEREKAAAEREKAAAAREQQMEAIRQIQEEMRRRREAEEQQKAEAQQQQQQQPQPES